MFANTPASACIRKGDPTSYWAIARLILSRGEGQYEAWAGLRDNIGTGKIAFDRIYSENYWQFLQRNPAQSAIFNEGMRSLSAPMTSAVTAAYDWGRFPLIADIGGGIGANWSIFLMRIPPAAGFYSISPMSWREPSPMTG